MKYKYYTHFLMILFISIFSVKGMSQPNIISNVLFHPPTPTCGDTIHLHIELIPTNEKLFEINIELIAYSDINNDFRYTESSEEIIHTIKKVKDNDEKDESPLISEICIPVYTVPKDNLPEKYIAIVSCGKSTISSSIIVPYEQKKISVCAANSGIGIFESISKIFYDVANRIESIKWLIRKNEPRPVQQDELHNIYIYNLNNKELISITNDKTKKYYSPCWSFDGKKLAFIVEENNSLKIAWTSVKNKNIKIISSGPSDLTPFWLPDNTHIAFLKEHKIKIVNIETQAIICLAENIRVDKILGISKGQNKITQIIFQASNKYTEMTKEIYMIETDVNFNIRSPKIQLLNSPIWFFISNISPTADSIIYCEDNSLYITPVNELKPVKLFNDNNIYFDPAWSPHERIITFISNRSN